MIDKHEVKGKRAMPPRCATSEGSLQMRVQVGVHVRGGTNGLREAYRFFFELREPRRGAGAAKRA